MRDPEAADERIATFEISPRRIANPREEYVWFRQLLSDRGVTLHPASHLALSLDWLEEMARGIEGHYVPPAREDQSEKLCSAASIFFLARAMRGALECNPNAFASKWSLFRGANVSLIGQPPRTAERDKVWELLIAALCERVFDNVSIADHENPDVTCYRRGEKWGIECKCLYTRKPSAQRDLLIDKVDQLETAGIENGVIAVNLTPVIDHSRYLDTFRFFPTRSGFDDLSGVGREFGEQVEKIVRQIDTAPFRRRVFKNERPTGPRKNTRLILFWAQTLGLSMGQLVQNCQAKWIAYEEAEARDLAFMNRFQLALSFVAGQTSPDG